MSGAVPFSAMAACKSRRSSKSSRRSCKRSTVLARAPTFCNTAVSFIGFFLKSGRERLFVFGVSGSSVVAGGVRGLSAKRGNFAEFFDDLGKVLQEMVHFLGGVVNAQAETDAAAGAGGAEAHGGQDMGRRQRAGGAGGTAGGADADLVQQKEDGLGFDEIEGDVAGVGHARFLSTVADGVGDGGENGALHAVAQGADAGVFVVEIGQGQLGGAAEGDDGGDVLGAGAAPAFLMAAEEIGLEFGAALDIEQPHALGGMKFMGGKGEQIGVQRLDI